MVREYLPEEYTKEDRDLIKVFQQTMNELELAYLKAIHSNDTIKANAFLKKIKGVAKTLNDEYSDRADIRITEEYLKGVKYLDEAGEIEDTIGFVDFSKGKAKEMIGELGPAHVQAVNALLNTSKNYVKSSLDGLERQTMSLIGELQQQRVREELAKGILKGESRFEVNKKVTKYFEEQNLGFKDRAGRIWTMDRYVDMLTRTETAIANVQGTINRGIQVGLTKFRVIEHFDCCSICANYNGDVFDISKGMVNLPPYHPNCRGYIEAVIDGHDKYKEKNEKIEQIKNTWFGEGETQKQNLEKLKSMPAVSSIKGNEFQITDAKKLTEKVASFFEKEYGSEVYRDGRTIYLSTKGIKSSIHHNPSKKKFSAFKSVPNIIKYGEETSYKVNRKGNGLNTRVYSAPIEINGERHIGIVSVNETVNGDGYFYLHHIIKESKL